MSFTALDANIPLTGAISCLKQHGITAVGRYYTKNKKNAKLLSAAEAQALSRAGIHIWAIYQDRQNQIADFTRAKGLAAGKVALEYAREVIKQPPGSAIYFSVDFDPTASQYKSGVLPFFEGIVEAFSEDANAYKAGCYASGMVCKSLLDAGLVHYTWLTMSKGFSGTPEFTKSKKWNMVQLLEVKDFCGLSSCDPNTINPEKADFGAFVLEAAGPAKATVHRRSGTLSPNVLPARPAMSLKTAAAKASDADHIARLLEIASNTSELVAMQHIAAKKLLEFDGEVYPSDGCAITLSVLLQQAGIGVPDIFKAIDLGNRLKTRGWQVIPVGEQRVGDVGSTCRSQAHHGQDHIYLVLKVLNEDEMVIADNQAPAPHFRYASGKGGKTPTQYFLRAT